MNYYPYAENGRWWLSTPLGFGLGMAFAVLLLWSLFWKGLALWKSARGSHKWWFVILLLVNTAGILDILYIYVFSKRMKKSD
mgnify:CR=1 FL=1